MMPMTRFRALLMLLSALASPSLAADRPVVVEMFTSQGCSACPSADAFLGELAARDDIIALALHVDYWDYIGWKDSFARPEFTDRQRGYAHERGSDMVYTPQMVIDGTDAVIGNRRADVTELVARHAEASHRVALSARRLGDRLEIRAEALPGTSGTATVELVRFRPHASIRVTRGENAGRTLVHTNVVTALDALTQWDMSAPLALSVPIDGDLPAVVLVQRGQYGPIEAAARVR